MCINISTFMLKNTVSYFELNDLTLNLILIHNINLVIILLFNN